MDTFELLQRLSVALAVGLVIGLERGWQARKDPEGERAVGFRTHALAGLLGGVWGAVAHSTGNGGAIAIGLAFCTFSASVILFRYRESAHDGTFGVTTVVAAMLAFALGAFAVVGDMRAAAATGVAATCLLALKSALHAWLKRLSWIELRSGLVLLAMTFILLPLLPNRTVDPWDSINPYELWLMTIMIAAISFSGYVAIKLVGEEKGILITGLAGGLASSTAVTLTLARLAREHPEQRDRLVAGALMAAATMVARVLVIVGVVNASLLIPLAMPLGLAGVALAGAGIFLLRQAATPEGSKRGLQLKNPFELTTVLKFGALLTVVSVLAKVVTAKVGDAGAYGLALVSGIADVDAITLSMAHLAGGSLGVEVAARAIALAVAVNSISKSIMGWVAGGAEFGSRLTIASVVAIAAGVAGYLVNVKF